MIRLYNYLITSFAVKEIDPKPFQANQLAQVLREKRYSFITYTQYDFWYEDIQTKISSPYYELREAVRDNPIIIFTNTSNNWDIREIKLLERVNQEKLVAVIENDYQSSFFADNNFCDFVYLEVGLFERYQHLNFRVHFLREINIF
jgi:hypothetical protein